MSETTSQTSARAGRTTRIVRIVLPFVVSGLLFAVLFARVDAGEVLGALTGKVALRWLPALVLFNVVTLAIEARCLHRVAGAVGASLAPLTAARIKAACYLLAILNYVIGAAGLSILLRRRTGLGLADAASMVFLISLFDIGSVLAMAALGAGFLTTETLGLRIGLIGSMLAAILAGFLFLRVPTRIPPLEWLRTQDVFRSPRTAPIGLLVEIGVLRAAFILCYVGLMWALLWAFDISVEPMRLALNVAIMLAVAALPIAAGGLGTGQIVFVEIFRGAASDAELLAASLVFSLGVIAARALLGLVFAMEFTREALDAAREETRS